MFYLRTSCLHKFYKISPLYPWPFLRENSVTLRIRFSITAVTDGHQCSGLSKHKFIILKSGRSEVQNESRKTKIKVSAELHPSKGSREEPVPLLFRAVACIQFLEVAELSASSRRLSAEGRSQRQVPLRPWFTAPFLRFLSQNCSWTPFTLHPPLCPLFSHYISKDNQESFSAFQGSRD